MTFTHPETGEVLDSREDFEAALDALEARLASVYRLIRPIRSEWGARFNAPELPAPRYRTQTQEKVSLCPRCGGRIESEEPPE